MGCCFPKGTDLDGADKGQEVRTGRHLVPVRLWLHLSRAPQPRCVNAWPLHTRELGQNSKTKTKTTNPLATMDKDKKDNGPDPKDPEGAHTSRQHDAQSGAVRMPSNRSGL